MKYLIQVSLSILLLMNCFSSETGLKNVPAQDSELAIGIEENLGGMIPLDLSFKDEAGADVTLSSYIDKPVILTLVYYRCPGICSPLLEGLTKAIDRVKIKSGQDYKLVTLSFDPTETPELARQKKANYLKTMKNPPEDKDWVWLSGDEESIRKVTDATGFRYKREGKDFIHSATLIAVSPSGKISRYLYGTSFLPFDIQLALAEAQAERTGPTIAKLLKFCFSYDPGAKKYVLQVTRIIGTVMLMILAGFLLFLVYGGPKRTDVDQDVKG